MKRKKVETIVSEVEIENGFYYFADYKNYYHLSDNGIIIIQDGLADGYGIEIKMKAGEFDIDHIEKSMTVSEAEFKAAFQRATNAIAKAVSDALTPTQAEVDKLF